MSNEIFNAVMKYDIKQYEEKHSIPSIDDILNNHTEKEVYDFINALTTGFKEKYQKFPLTHQQSQNLKISVDDPEYKQNILLTNEFGVDMSTKEGSELILCKEDADLMDKARVAEKKRVFRLIAKEEMRLGILPISQKTMKNINSIKYIQDLEQKNISDKKDLKHSICIDIETNTITEEQEKKILSKTWVKNNNKFTKTNNGYMLIVGYEYTKSDGSVSNRTMSMMKKELSSTLKINKDYINARVICKDEYLKLTTEEVD